MSGGGCFTFGGAIVCRPRFERVEARIMACPTCKRRRRMVAKLQDWYGWLVTCTGCGDSWNDGERLMRPCYRAWRRDVAAKAMTEWRKAVKRAMARDRGDG